MQKQQLEQSKDERATTRGNVVGPKPTSYKPFGTPKKDKDYVVDYKDQQVQTACYFFWGGGVVGNHADMVYVNL